MTGAASTLSAAILGAIIGSFLNVCIYRLPLGKSVAWPGSACPNCGRSLAWFENLPVVGDEVTVLDRADDEWLTSHAA